MPLPSWDDVELLHTILYCSTIYPSAQILKELYPMRKSSWMWAIMRNPRVELNMRENHCRGSHQQKLQIRKMRSGSGGARCAGGNAEKVAGNCCDPSNSAREQHMSPYWRTCPPPTAHLLPPSLSPPRPPCAVVVICNEEELLPKGEGCAGAEQAWSFGGTVWRRSGAKDGASRDCESEVRAAAAATRQGDGLAPIGATTPSWSESGAPRHPETCVTEGVRRWLDTDGGSQGRSQEKRSLGSK
jgi:hypothetical protein